VHLIEFPNPRLPTVVWQETVTTRGLITESGQVRDIMLTYQDALKNTLSAQQSLELLHQRIKELD
jgi:hypothetical protein